MKFIRREGDHILQKIRSDVSCIGCFYSGNNCFSTGEQECLIEHRDGSKDYYHWVMRKCRLNNKIKILLIALLISISTLLNAQVKFNGNIELGYKDRLIDISYDNIAIRYYMHNSLYGKLYNEVGYKNISLYTSVNTYFKPITIVSYDPSMVEYKIGARYSYKSITIGYEHMCSHQFLENILRMSEGYDRLSIIYHYGQNKRKQIVFLRFLKEYRAYNLWIKNICQGAQEEDPVGHFLNNIYSKNPEQWIVSAFCWSDDLYKSTGIEWERLHELWEDIVRSDQFSYGIKLHKNIRIL